MAYQSNLAKAPCRKSLVAATLIALIMPVAAGAQSAGHPPPSTAVGRMGQLMSASAARHGVAFVPFLPPRRIVEIALLPPFHGEDDRANRGMAYEYLDSAGRRYALAEWPRNGGSIATFGPLPFAEPGCPEARSVPRGTSPNGIVWTTARGLVMTLVADGPNDARTLEREWSKLIRRGVCR